MVQSRGRRAAGRHLSDQMLGPPVFGEGPPHGRPVRCHGKVKRIGKIDDDGRQYATNDSVKIGSYKLPLPRSASCASLIGVALIIGGLF